LKLEEGAILELGRFERVPSDSRKVPLPNPLAPTVADAPGENLEASHSGDAETRGSSELAPGPGNRVSRRRFSHFPFRRRSAGQSVSGPALALVDAEPLAEATKGKEEVAEGVKLTIRLAALDEQGTELASPNEQITYLHVVRFGPGADTEHEEDTRPWVVKVVKREATVSTWS